MSKSNNSSGQLTRHPVGSMGEIWSMSWPLMLMALSTYALIFGDRLIVARYSVDAMNAIGVVSATYAIFQFGFLTLALIAEVFVGQYNGSDQQKRVGEPVWQMIWFSLMTAVIFIPIGLYAGEYLISDKYMAHGEPYFRWMMLSGIFAPMGGALSAFFVGRGKTVVVTTVVALTNVLNLGLDYLFVFGVGDIIPEMGTVGAAIATGIALIMQCVILMMVFTSAKNRERYGTGKYQFSKEMFMRCFRVGFPTSLSMVVGIAAWAMFFRLIGDSGDIYITTLVISQNYYFVICIMTEGIGKAVTAISSNLIGAVRRDEVRAVVKSAKYLLGVFVTIFLVPFVIFPEPAISIFAGDMMDVPGFYEVAREGMLFTWVMFIFFGMFWIYSSQLTAAGDTKFIMYTNMLVAWLGLILPAWLLISVLGYSADLAWKIMTVEILAAMILFWARVRSEKWKQIDII